MVLDLIKKSIYKELKDYSLFNNNKVGRLGGVLFPPIINSRFNKTRLDEVYIVYNIII